jgi:hypothetical protein
LLLFFPARARSVTLQATAAPTLRQRGFRVAASPGAHYGRGNGTPSYEEKVMPVRFVALATSLVRSLQAGGPDANGQTPERHVSPGRGIPCRHCLKLIAAGEPYLILSHRPFPSPQPYAEQGPIFLHADACAPHLPSAELPAMLASERYLVRGYGADDRIVYGSGQIVPTLQIVETAEAMFADPRLAYVHIRSAANNCYQCRLERTP